MKNFLLVSFVLVASYAHSMELECRGEHKYGDERISVSKIKVSLPSVEKNIYHNDMRLEVVDLFTPWSSVGNSWIESDTRYFSYFVQDNQINFDWPGEHSANLASEDGKVYRGEMILVSRLHFNVECELH